MTSSRLLPPGESLNWLYTLLGTRHIAHYGQIWRHPQNRKHMTYCLSSEEDRATVPWPLVTCTETFVKSGMSFRHIRADADRRTYRRAHRNTSYPYRVRSNDFAIVVYYKGPITLLLLKITNCKWHNWCWALFSSVFLTFYLPHSYSI